MLFRDSLLCVEKMKIRTEKLFANRGDVSKLFVSCSQKRFYLLMRSSTTQCKHPVVFISCSRTQSLARLSFMWNTMRCLLRVETVFVNSLGDQVKDVRNQFKIVFRTMENTFVLGWWTLLVLPYSSYQTDFLQCADAARIWTNSPSPVTPRARTLPDEPRGHP